MASSGCVCVTNGGGRSGDIIFTWNFAGQPCALVPDVAQVAVQIPGQTLQNNGVYGCVNAGTAGIRLLNFRAGTYDYIISGQDSRGVVIYQATGKVTVNGDVAMDVTLQPTSEAKGSARMYWSLPAGSNVDCATIQTVDISVNGTLITSAPCTQGMVIPGRQDPPGALITGIFPGQNTFTLSARDGNSFFYYRSDFTLNVVAGQEIAENRTLQWAVGSLPVRWSFSNGASALNCNQAGITSVFVNLRDSTGAFVYSGAGTQLPCTNANGFDGTLFPYLYADVYGLVVQACDGANRLYTTNQNTPPQGAVVAGNFPLVDASTPVALVAVNGQFCQ
ncbi:MAG: hypothetical protein ACO1OB_26245 [Archangium sp.]